MNFCALIKVIALIELSSSWSWVHACISFSMISTFFEFKKTVNVLRLVFYSQTRLTLEEIVPDSEWIRNVLVPHWFCCLHTRGRIRNENIPVWSCLRRFWIRNLKRELWINFWIRKVLPCKSFSLESGYFFEFAVELKWRIHQSKGLIKVVFVLMPIDDGRW